MRTGIRPDIHRRFRRVLRRVDRRLAAERRHRNRSTASSDGPLRWWGWEDDLSPNDISMPALWSDDHVP